MAHRFWTSLVVMSLLAGCGGNPFVDAPVVPVDPVVPGDTADPTTGVIVPANVKKAMISTNLSEYNAGDATVNIQMNAQDAAALKAVYTRNAAFDVGPVGDRYEAYTYQETTSNRYVVALVKTAGLNNHKVKGVVAVEAGQFANYHGGGIYTRADVFTAPTGAVGAQRVFDYSGTYAGLMNIGPDTPGGPGGELNPSRSYLTTGRTLVTADFNEMTVSGGIDNRSVIDTGEVLASQFLFESGAIDAKGNFAGKTQRNDSGKLNDSGVYAGIFSGDNAREIAMLLVFNPYQGDTVTFEHGIFVESNCAVAGGPACP